MRTDILLDDDDDDLLDTNGDLVEGPSAEQEAYQAIDSEKGEWRQFPTAGMGLTRRISRRVGDTPLIENPERFKRDAKVELEADGHQNPEIIVNEDLSDFKIYVDE